MESQSLSSKKSSHHESDVMVQPLVIPEGHSNNTETHAMEHIDVNQPGAVQYPEVVAFKKARKVNQKIALGCGFVFGMALFGPIGIGAGVAMGVVNAWAFHGISKHGGRAQQRRLQKDLETDDRLARLETLLSDYRAREAMVQ